MIQEDEGAAEPGTSEVVDLSARLRPRPLGVTSPTAGNQAGAYALFLVVSRDAEAADHELHYVFLEGAPTVIEAQNFVRSHPATFGEDVAVVELRESFADMFQAVEKARLLKRGAPGANVLAPALRMGRLEAE